MYDNIKKQVSAALSELLEKAGLQVGDIFVLGCSSSEIVGSMIGKGSSPEAAAAVFEAAYPLLDERKIYLAAQCCEHLNRALVIERAAAERYGYEPVNAVPQIHAGGSFAVQAFEHFSDPVLVEAVKARAGMDIGSTLIGMHLAPVAVPVRVGVKHVGEAVLVCARTRPKYIGGERAKYFEA